MIIVEFNRDKAVAYAREWAYGRNPKYFNFNSIGGDCTNYASQCLYAGSGVMNFTPVAGWYYRSLNDRAPAWTGVEYFHKFLINNQSLGPFAKEVPLEELQLGDFVQLGRATGDYYHTPIVCGFSSQGILLAAHTFDTYNKSLNDYYYESVRGIHILGVRKDG